MPELDANHRLDVRNLEEPPFETIMRELEALPSGERLLLINDFEPRPLYSVLTDRGFAYEAEEEPDGTWRVLIEEA